jgi:hypothetical protein
VREREKINSLKRQHRLQRLLDSLLRMKTKDRIGDPLDRKQSVRRKPIVAREPKQNSWNVVWVRHQAASGRPSESAA